MKYEHLGLCYLCSPYTSPSADIMRERFSRTALATRRLMEFGVLVFSPILHSVPMVECAGAGTTWNDWAAYDTAFIRRCSRVFVLMLDGWDKSVGVKAEMELCAKLGIPVTLLHEECIESTVLRLALEVTS